mmetsp:Transcript_20943/g.29056  ORF Transcript_20943/g.29056 Transcript_20943/m.29056 type:complete len:238 (-) Transcript_20943:182-895(-)
MKGSLISSSCGSRSGGPVHTSRSAKPSSFFFWPGGSWKALDLKKLVPNSSWFALAPVEDPPTSLRAGPARQCSHSPRPGARGTGALLRIDWSSSRPGYTSARYQPNSMHLVSNGFAAACSTDGLRQRGDVGGGVMGSVEDSTAEGILCRKRAWNTDSRNSLKPLFVLANHLFAMFRAFRSIISSVTPLPTYWSEKRLVVLWAILEQLCRTATPPHSLVGDVHVGVVLGAVGHEAVAK